LVYWRWLAHTVHIGEYECRYTFRRKIFREKNYLEDIGVDEKIILIWILNQSKEDELGGACGAHR
jgi:hypothetical protein